MESTTLLCIVSNSSLIISLHTMCSSQPARTRAHATDAWFSGQGWQRQLRRACSCAPRQAAQTKVNSSGKTTPARHTFSTVPELLAECGLLLHATQPMGGAGRWSGTPTVLGEGVCQNIGLQQQGGHLLHGLAALRQLPLACAHDPKRGMAVGNVRL